MHDRHVYIVVIIICLYYREAYKIACLGVTESDWKLLAMDALEVLRMYNIALSTNVVINQ